MLQTLDALAPCLVLIVACSQAVLPVAGVPVATLFLILAAAWRLIRQRGHLPSPRIGAAHIAFLMLLGVGLLGLDRTELGDGLRKLAQTAEIFVLVWYVFTTIQDHEWRWLNRAAGFTVVVLAALGAGKLYAWPGLELSDAKRGAFLCLGLPFLLTLLPEANRALRIAALVILPCVVAVSSANGGLLLVFLLTLLVGTALLDRPGFRWALCGTVWAVLAASIVPGAGSDRSAWDSLCSRYDETHSKRIFIEYKAAMHAPAEFPLGGGLGQYRPCINILRQEVPLNPHPEDKRVPENGNGQYLLTLVEAGCGAALALLILFGSTMAQALAGWRKAPLPERNRYATVAVSLMALLLASLFCTTLSRGIGIWVGALLGLAASLHPSVPGAPWRLRWLLAGLPAGLCLAAAALWNVGADPLNRLTVANQEARRALVRIGLLTTKMKAEPQRSAGGLEIVQLDDDPREPLCIEAESFLSATGLFLRIPSNDASGNQAVEIPFGAGKGKGHAVYEVELPAAGEYQLSARVLWHDGCANSLGFCVNGEEARIESERFHTWHTLICRRTFSLPSGRIKILVRNLEEGVRCDYFELQPAAAEVSNP